ncbi:MAG: rubredoxin [Candidatus Marinimicrobia bacterium]|nr:rubredoxin [Candidatus Neomarinimicrobiota bacterium]
MAKYVAHTCSFFYESQQDDPGSGVERGTKSENLPDDWVCPECGASKDQFDYDQ